MPVKGAVFVARNPTLPFEGHGGRVVLGCRDGGRWWVSSKTCLLGLLAWPATLVTYGATVCMRAVGLFVCLGVALCFERCRVSGGLEDSCVL